MLSLGTRVHGRYRVEDRLPHHQFQLRRARLRTDFDPLDWLDSQLDFDLSDAPALKDAWVRFKPWRWLRITVGQFKKPFSRLELTNAGRLPFWRRGLVNDRFVDELRFGGRDLGLSLSGRIGDFRYDMGLFNGNRTLGEIDTGKDGAVRLTYRPFKNLRLGASGALKYRNVEDVEYVRHAIWAVGLDARFRGGPFDIVGELLWAEEGSLTHGPRPLGGLLYVVLRIPLNDTFELRPLVKGELLDDDVAAPRDLAGSITLGANLRIRDFFRFMVQAEQWFSQGGSRVESQRRVVFQLALDYELDLIQTDAQNQGEADVPPPSG